MAWVRALMHSPGHPILGASVRREVCSSGGLCPLELRLGTGAGRGCGKVTLHLRCQCADDPDAVCTRSVTVRLSALHNSLVKLKHGGGVAIDGQDVQIPLLQGELTTPSSML